MTAGFSLDHLGVAVRDLAEARETYAKLGFTLTDLSIHSGNMSADGKVQPLGSGNHCAMFRVGYLELIGLVHPERPSAVGPFLQSGRHGGFITAFGYPDAERAYEIASHSFPTAQRPVILERVVDDAEGKPATAGFRNVLLGPAFEESRVLVIQHMTRDLIWRENLTAHPNGVVGLGGARFLVKDPRQAAERYSRLVGVAPKREDDDAVLELGRQEVRFVSEAGFPQKGAERVHSPSLFGATMHVANVGETRRLFERNDVAFTISAGGDLLVAPEQACGFALTFSNLEKA